jgi:hypothetical protein
MMQKHFAEGGDSFRKAYTIDPANLRGLPRLSQIHFEQNEPDQVPASLREAGVVKLLKEWNDLGRNRELMLLVGRPFQAAEWLSARLSATPGDFVARRFPARTSAQRTYLI